MVNQTSILIRLAKMLSGDRNDLRKQIKYLEQENKRLVKRYDILSEKSRERVKYYEEAIAAYKSYFNEITMSYNNLDKNKG